jgi:hypothetical protein
MHLRLLRPLCANPSSSHLPEVTPRPAVMSKGSAMSLQRIADSDAGCTRIRQIPGIGPCAMRKYQPIESTPANLAWYLDGYCDTSGRFRKRTSS